MSIAKVNKYHAYLLNVERDPWVEVLVGDYSNLSMALVNARVACAEREVGQWDWVVDKLSPSGEIINRRSSIGGFEPLR